MYLNCPRCESSERKPCTRFHWQQDQEGRQYLCCERTKECGWRAEIVPPLPFHTTPKREAAGVVTEVLRSLGREAANEAKGKPKLKK
jgi:hypothetical protein